MSTKTYNSVSEIDWKTMMAINEEEPFRGLSDSIAGHAGKNDARADAVGTAAQEMEVKDLEELGLSVRITITPDTKADEEADTQGQYFKYKVEWWNTKRVYDAILAKLRAETPTL